MCFVLALHGDMGSFFFLISPTITLGLWCCNSLCPILTVFLTLTTLPQSNSKLKLVRSLAVCEESSPPPIPTDLLREHQVNPPSPFYECSIPFQHTTLTHQLMLHPSFQRIIMQLRLRAYSQLPIRDVPKHV